MVQLTKNKAFHNLPQANGIRKLVSDFINEQDKILTNEISSSPIEHSQSDPITTFFSEVPYKYSFPDFQGVLADAEGLYFYKTIATADFIRGELGLSAAIGKTGFLPGRYMASYDNQTIFWNESRARIEEEIVLPSPLSRDVRVRVTAFCRIPADTPTTNSDWVFEFKSNESETGSDLAGLDGRFYLSGKSYINGHWQAKSTTFPFLYKLSINGVEQPDIYKEQFKPSIEISLPSGTKSFRIEFGAKVMAFSNYKYSAESMLPSQYAIIDLRKRGDDLHPIAGYVFRENLYEKPSRGPITVSKLKFEFFEQPEGTPLIIV